MAYEDPKGFLESRRFKRNQLGVMMGELLNNILVTKASFPLFTSVLMYSAYALVR